VKAYKNSRVQNMKNLGCVAYIGEINVKQKKNSPQIEEVMVTTDSATGQINFYKFKIKLLHRWY
jgi:hypothetical protein